MAGVSTTLQQFQRVGNLAFYDGFHQNYIYFKSLKGGVYQFKQPDGTYTDYKNKAYEVLANKAVNDVVFQKDQFSLNNPKSFLQESNYAKKFEQCLKIVHKGIEYETKNEIAYFKQRLKDFEDTFTKEDIEANPEVAKIRALLERGCAQDKIVDYQEFLALVNGLLSGFKEAYTIAKYEHKHIKSISDALQGILDNRKSQLQGLAHKKQMSFQAEEDMIKKSLERLNKKMNVYYVQHKTYNKSTETRYNRKTGKNETVNASLRGSVRAFRSVHQATDNEIAKWMRKQLETIFSNTEVMASITTYLKQQGAVKLMADYTDAANEIKSMIAVALAEHASEYIPEIINRQYRSLPKQKIVNLLENSIDLFQTYRIEGFYPNHFMTGRHLKGLQEMEEGFDLHEASSEMFMKMFVRLKAANEKRGRKLSKERSQLYNLLNGKSIYKDFSELENITQRLLKAEEQKQQAEEKLKKGKYDFTNTKEYIEQVKLGNNDKGEPVMLHIRITKRKVMIVDDLGESIRSLPTIQKLFGDKQLTFSTIKNSVANLHRQGSMALRIQMADLVDEMIAEAEQEDQQQLKKELYNVIKNGLQNLHINVRGPDESEVRNAINFRTNDKYQIVVDLSGPKNIKNDHITISLDRRDVRLSIPMQTILDNKDRKMAEMITEKVSSEEMAATLNAKVVSTFEKSISQAFTQNSTKAFDRYSSNARAFLQGYETFKNRNENMNKTYEKMWDEWELYSQEIANRGESKAYQDKKYEDFLHAIEKTFYVSTTVKSYDYYNDSIGFGGGSLGGSLLSQLQNIADIFKLAGCPISTADVRWLFFLIRNTGEHTIFDTEYQSIIEQYFSSLAAFMLFDEGGAEVKILKDLQKNASVSYSSPKILHLYYVNGIYVTGSYVLRKAEEELINYQKIMEGVLVSKNEGANIRIINTMNEGMIHNRGANATPTPTENPWVQVAKEANNNVRLEIFFLAGLLDIADKLESTLANIQLPTK